MKVDNIADLIGNTPLVRLNRLNDTNTIIYAKMECNNPLHSVRERTALAMIETAESEGKLGKGYVIIEPASGNTGIALAFIAAVKGYKIILTMPETMSVERCKILSALGAKVLLTEESKGMQGAIKAAEELAASIKNSFIPRHYNNFGNPGVHEKTTGPEIWKDTLGHVDILVGCIGTDGALAGAGKYLKKIKKNMKVIAAQTNFSVVSCDEASEITKKSIIDEIIVVNDEDAANTVRLLAKKEGILAGISSGAAIFGALTAGKRPENAGKTIVAILPDTGELFLSALLWDDL